MQRFLYEALSGLPSKAVTGAIGLGGIAATAWPEKFRKWISGIMTADQIQFYGVVGIVLCVAYWALLAWLRPKEVENGPGLSSVTHGASSPAIGVIHGNPTFHLGSPPLVPTQPEKSLFPSTGYSIHFLTRLSDHQVDRRRYLITCWEGCAEIAMFISASDVFTLCVTDQAGEEYTLQTPVGRRGVPVAEIVLLSAEIGIEGAETHLRISINNESVATRTLGFAINLPPITFQNYTLFSNRSGNQNGAARLYALLTISRILTEIEKSQLLEYFRAKP
jgi:hypothetical protein